MSLPIKQEFETHTPAAIEILFYYLSATFASHKVRILKNAKPNITKADMDIVKRTLDDGEARSILLSSAEQNRAFLDCMGAYFNHLAYSDGLFRVANAGKMVFDSAEELMKSRQEYSRLFEEYTRDLFTIREDGNIYLALPRDQEAWTALVSNTQRDMENYRDEYTAAAKRTSDLVMAAAEQFMELAKVLQMKLEE
ncbi:hypothetical protein GQX73_g1904 [Xylaria multiplex]|uniref:Uncharacterized protein n=1 Tax=Xylaria multiplex TaxID=323545 RepID=A0A7C8N2S0_9PEZI|nr:hypothetical protein GQX73_g1904 [Xylaria multiplex]